jgi:hypothetical protein
MKRIISVVFGLVGVFVGLGVALPALARLKAQDAVPTCALLFLGLVILTGGIAGAVYGLVRHDA